MGESKPTVATIAALCGLVGCSALAAADDEVQPDMAFLEYLGSWEESDEDWVMLAAEAIEQDATDAAPTGPTETEEQVAETDDES